MGRTAARPGGLLRDTDADYMRGQDIGAEEIDRRFQAALKVIRASRLFRLDPHQRRGTVCDVDESESQQP